MLIYSVFLFNIALLVFQMKVVFDLMKIESSENLKFKIPPFEKSENRTIQKS